MSEFIIENDVLKKYTGSDRHVVVPDGIKIIGNFAFSSLLPDDFKGYENMVSITLPESLTTIGNSAFKKCKNLTSITIPSGVTEIGDFAFADCESLSSIVIPEGVISIGALVFRGCFELTSIDIPKSVTNIGYAAFRYNGWIANQPEFVVVNGILCEYQGDEATIRIPDDVRTITEGAFSRSMRWLVSVEIPDSVTTICDGAFLHDGIDTSIQELQEITVPRRFEEDLPRIFCDTDLSQITIHWL